MTPLPDRAAVGIIGAGPAGSFFALHLQEMLKGSGRSVRITLFDRKSFDDSGPSGCNMCAGAIGKQMAGKIQGIGLPLDERVIQRIADGYEIHGRDFSVNVLNPERGTIYTVFRGGGPVASPGERRSFDQFLLDAAVSRGAEFLHERVESRRAHPGGFRVRTAEGNSRDFDFLVGAFGVNSAITKMLCTRVRPAAHVAHGSGRVAGRQRIHHGQAWQPDPYRPRPGKGDPLSRDHAEKQLPHPDGNRRIRPDRESRARADGKSHPAASAPSRAKVLCHCHPKVPVGTARNPSRNASRSWATLSSRDT